MKLPLQQNATLFVSMIVHSEINANGICVHYGDLSIYLNSCIKHDTSIRHFLVLFKPSEK